MLDVSISADSKPQRRVQQTWQDLTAGIYERQEVKTQPGEENGFSGSIRGGGASFQAGRFRLHFLPPSIGLPAVDLDLTQQPDGCWHGLFRRGSFSSRVTLCRPTASSTIRVSPLVGTWSQEGFGGTCMHVRQNGAHSFVGWFDSLPPLGLIRFGPNTPAPHTLSGHFGELAKVQLSPKKDVSFELGAHNGICCPHLFSGKLCRDGNAIDGAWPSAMNQAPHAARWEKIPGKSCVRVASR